MKRSMSREMTSTGLMLIMLMPALSTVPASAKPSPREIAKRKETIHEDLLKIYLAQDRRPDVEKEYKTLLAMKPSSAKLNFDYGRYLAVGHSEASSIPYLVKACTNDPMNAAYAGTLGTAYLRVKNFPKAVEWLRKAVSLPGGAKYKKTYQSAFKYIQYQRQVEIRKKRQEEYRKRQAAARKKQQQREEDDW